MKFFIKKFTLRGYDKDYSISFRKGLNFISGPTYTGKTTIFELIDYALGSKNHKAYIEVNSKCTDVELELLIDSKQYKIRRKLFNPKLPLSVEMYSPEKEKYINYGVFGIDSIEGKETISDFLLSKLSLDGINISNQKFSFRDLFKYSYIKQTEIDNENLFNANNNYVLGIKRKATFEIIFNIYDDLLSNLKKEVKEKEEYLKLDKIKYDGISDFLDTAGIDKPDQIKERNIELENEIKGLKTRLSEISITVKENEGESIVAEYLNKLRKYKSEREEYLKKYEDLKQYLIKLYLLSNQYSKDIDKIDAAILGIREMNKYDFKLCPNCLKPISEHKESEKCLLCDSEMESVIENISLLKSEKKSIQKKKKELEVHIDNQKLLMRNTEREKEKLEEKVIRYNKIINEMTNQFVSPFIDEISLINRRIGEINREIEELLNSERLISELNSLTVRLSEKENDLTNLKNKILHHPPMADKNKIVSMISEEFNSILSQFMFPKLENAVIGSKDYYPYVRGNRYDQIGSSGAVTLLTMAYYLAIFVSSKDEEYNHLNVLMIDTPRKNLGADSKEPNFRDEEIYNSVIRYLISIDKSLSEELQLLVINNGYPDFLPRETIVAEFTPEGTVGLIDDI